MKFKDVAHLYIGCKVQWLRIDDNTLQVSYFALSDAWWLLNKQCKPILYPLSAVKQRELRNEIAFGIGYQPESFVTLLAARIDLFNLIESGEAIDVTTLKTNPYLTTKVDTK